LNRVGLVLLGVALFLPPLFLRDVWAPTETRYAQITREMEVTGDYVLPHLNGEIYPDKPPLFFWAAAGLRRLGAGADSGRILNVLAGIGALLLVAALARLWFPRRTAILAAVVLGTSFEFAWVTQSGVLGTPLTLFTTLAVYGWFAGRRALPLFYLGIACAILIKGPVGVMVPVVAVLAGRLAGVPGPGGWRHLLWGLPLTVLPGAVWLWAAWRAGGTGYVEQLLGHHIADRLVDSWAHEGPFWFYLSQPQVIFPWVFVAIPSFVWAWRQGRAERPLRLLFWWFLICFVVLSAVSGKRLRYLLPLLPAFALLVGRALDTLIDTPPADTGRRWMRILCGAQHVTMALLGLALAVAGAAGPECLERLPALQTHAAEAITPFLTWPAAARPLLLGLALSALGLLGLLAARQHAPRKAVIVLCAEAILYIGLFALYQPVMDTWKSPRAVTERMDALVPPGQGEIALYPYALNGAYNVYSKRLTLRQLREPEELHAFLGAPEHRLVVTTEPAYAALADHASIRRVVVAGRDGKTPILLLLNFDGP